MAGGLTIEVDDDVLVENAASATLLSPGVWVQRPSRTAAATAAPLMAAQDVEMDEADDRPAPSSLNLDAAAAPAVQQTAAAAPAGTPQRPASQGQAAAAAAAAGTPPHSGGAMGSPGLGALDPDLAYLHISDDQERQEKEYLQQDREHMVALEEAHTRLLEQNRTMQEQLQSVMQQVEELAGENSTIKGLLAMLQVRREDFVFNPQQTIGAQQEAIGMRLLRNLEGSPPGAAQQQQQQQPQQQPQQQQQQPHPWSLQGQQAAQGQQAPPAAAGPAAQQQEAAEGQQQGGVPGAAAALGLDLMSPGSCMLPLGTPSMLRTVSPKIAAFRGTDPLAPGQPGQEQQPPAPPTVVPPSPYDFPEESQIAAAALGAKQGDPAAALLILLDKAVENRNQRIAEQQARRTYPPAPM